jgi:Uma2 family endonuclease
MVVSPAAAKVLTLEDWAAMDEDEPGEFVDGAVVEEEVPGLGHETVIVWLVQVLREWLIPRGGFVFGSAAKFVVTPTRGRKPDLTAYLPDCGPLPRWGLVRVPPSIAVEVITDTPRDARRDRVEKPDEYAAFGVRWYWLIDPVERTLEVFELGADGRYVRALAAADGDVTVPGCEGLVLPLDGLWAEVERLVEE